MTIRYICRNCKAVLYEYTGTTHNYRGALTPLEVAFHYGFKCPHCGSKLKYDTANPDWREHIVIKTAIKQAKRKRKERATRAKKNNKRVEVRGVTWISSTEFTIDEI